MPITTWVEGGEQTSYINVFILFYFKFFDSTFMDVVHLVFS